MVIPIILIGINEDNDLKDFSFKSDYQWDLSKDTQLQFGTFGSNYDIEYSYTQMTLFLLLTVMIRVCL